MNEHLDRESQSAPSSPAGERRTSMLDKIATELRQLHRDLASGDLAALRRMDPNSVPPAALFRLLARIGMTEAGPKAVRRWARAVHIMAQRPDTLRAGGLGRAMRETGFSEQRLDMLLNARGQGLFNLARRTAVRIARNHDALPYRDLCTLVLYDGRPEKNDLADDVRIRIAQSYLRADRETDKADGAPHPTD